MISAESPRFFANLFAPIHLFCFHGLAETLLPSDSVVPLISGWCPLHAHVHAHDLRACCSRISLTGRVDARPCFHTSHQLNSRGGYRCSRRPPVSIQTRIDRRHRLSVPSAVPSAVPSVVPSPPLRHSTCRSRISLTSRVDARPCFHTSQSLRCSMPPLYLRTIRACIAAAIHP